jgi:choline-sulfatase
MLSAADKPNILFIFADDHAYDTIHALGYDEIQTPNLDRLVKSGMTFTHTYNQGGYHGAVCVASRTMLNTGRFLWNAQAAEKTLKQNYQEKGRMWSQLLGTAGYDTYFTGKWHVRADTAEIFTVARNVRGGMPKQTKEGYNRPIEGQPDKWSPSDPKFGGFWQGGKHWSEVVGDDGVDYIKMASEKDKPFFMYLAFNAPHDPRQAPQSFVDMYPLDKISLPKPFMAEYPFNIGSNKIRDEKLAPFPRTEYSVKVNRQEYYAIITHMDQQIGRILDALDASGKADNTYIFFTADHGLGCGHHGLLGKQNVFDHSVRVPFMAVGPGIKADTRNSAHIYLQDVMPTSLELAGVEKPEDVQFTSILPQLKGAPGGGYPAIYGAYTGTQRMITAEGWKLVLYPKIKKTLLFNLKNDPHEITDLAGNPEHGPRISAMKKTLIELQAAVGDNLAL